MDGQLLLYKASDCGHRVIPVSSVSLNAQQPTMLRPLLSLLLASAVMLCNGAPAPMVSHILALCMFGMGNIVVAMSVTTKSRSVTLGCS